jgi:hypothetical protein
MLTIMRVLKSLQIGTSFVDLARRVHCFRNERVATTMVQLTLNPVVLLLLIKPGLRKRRPTESSAATL